MQTLTFKETIMRLFVIAVFALVALTAEARAGQYGDIWPWCLHVGGLEGGGINCGFESEAQCRAGRTGNTDMCTPNALFDPARHAPRPRAGKRRKG